ncbi:hypothetical protein GCM10010232_34600 [Streptomyces amakusaensis]|uniref:3-hydroxyacyl-CoA dehydrogenase NAD-binding domain-containing protein n=1 Tax=Streptomyces amakusaensis TaxID=67271 RepID=A0ABW0AHG4_9ACTN
MPANPVESVAVVGLGAVGTELSRRLTAAGLATVGVDHDPAAETSARRAVGSALFTATGDLSAIARADLVIEAVPEPEPGKHRVLGAVAGYRRPDAPVVTTALTTPAAELAPAARGDLLALRFLRADRLDAVELARAPHTGDAAAARVTDTLTRAGVTPLAVPDLPGSVAPALVFGLLNQAVSTCNDGYADRDSLETALRLGCNWSEGPLAVLDAIGDRTARDILEGLHRRLGPRYAPALPLAARPPARRPARRRDDGVTTVAVVGSGTMATGVAETVLRAGYRTLLVARSRRKAAAVTENIEFKLRAAGLKDDELVAALGRWSATDDLALIAGADLVIEAVAEDMAVKLGLFRKFGRLCREGGVLATTTSSLPVGECARASGRPQDVLGLHFFNPPPAMRLIELIRTADTGEAALARARGVAHRLGKVAVECGDRTGFIVNALLFPYLNDALRMLERPGIEPRLLDKALKSVGGQPLGPARLLDTIGLDVALDIQRRLHQESPRPELAPARLLEELVAHGHLGRKTPGRGVHARPAVHARGTAV